MAVTFLWPTDTKRVTSGFRTKERPTHHGVDIADPGARPIYAAADGVVSRSYVSASYGEVIFIVHEIEGKTWETVYAHLRTGSRGFMVGQRVRQGQQIGIMGNTGQSFGQHLHFELHEGRWNHPGKTNAVDPLQYLEKDLHPKPKKEYEVVKDVPGYTTAANAKAGRNRATTVRKGSYYVFNESDGMVNVTVQEGVPGSWINPADNKASSSTDFKVGQAVKVKASARTYTTGQNIPNWVKGQSYTVQQVEKDRVLLREILSWVRKTDVE